jgi:hypothetical protein
MNSNFRQGKRSGPLALTMLAAVVAFAGPGTPTQAQTFPVAFPAPTTFVSARVTSMEMANWMWSTSTLVPIST